MPNSDLTRRRLLTRGLTVAGAGLLAPSTLVACSRTEVGTGAAKQDTLKKIKKQGYVTIGFANERPYGYKDGDKITGQAPELHRAIWKTLGIKDVRGKVVSFDGLIPGLKANQFDAVAAGMYITPERCQEAAFSEPEYRMPEAFLVRKGNPKKISDYKSLITQKAVMGTLSGAVEVGYAKGSGVKKIQTYDDVLTGREAVGSGRIDAFAGTSLTLRTSLKDAPSDKFEVTEGFFPVVDGEEQPTSGASVFRVGDTSILDAYNEGLAKLKESGELLEILKPFGFTEEEMPSEEDTAEKLCGKGS
ncbi:MAG: ectoine/hydroxyectoine ABC transporter substrate-binding protein EhuB [Micromonosporaceae bacterium]